MLRRQRKTSDLMPAVAVKGGVNADKPSEEELENHGLVRKPKDTWTEIDG